MNRIFYTLALLLCLTACTELQLASHVTKQALPSSKSQGTFKVGNAYKINGKRYHPQESYDLVETGIASWYGPQFHGKKTANGETFDMYELTAAHKTLQMPSLVRVTNLDNGRSLIVRVNDRGPYKRGRIIDLSKRSAELLGFKDQGTAKVRLEVLKQESMEIARAAKSGKDTNGYEVALNRGGKMPSLRPQPVKVASATSSQAYQVEPAAGAQPPPVMREALISPTSVNTGVRQAIPGHTRSGAFYPDPIVTEMPVIKTDIFVQAGAFTVQENAYKLSGKLQQFAQANVYPAIVNGRQFYRVRLGPVASVQQADELLARLISSGNESAIIIVE